MIVLRVRCPKCGKEQKTTSLKTVRCIFCGRTYKVILKKGRTRIVRIERGSYEEYVKKFYEVYRNGLKNKKMKYEYF